MSFPTIEQLREHSLFGALDQLALQQLLQASRVERLSRHDSVFETCDPAEKVMLVLSGVVKLSSILGNGRELILDVFGPGDVLGDEAINQERRIAGATVLRDAVVLSFPAASLRATWAQDSEFAATWIGHLLQRRRRLQTRITELAYGNIEERLLRMLMHLSEDHSSATPDGSRVMNFPLTHQELASLIGATRETTTLAVGRLRSSGQIEFKERKIVLVDMASADVHSEEKVG